MQVAQGDYLVLSVAKRATLVRCSSANTAKDRYTAVVCKEQDTAKKTVMPIDFTFNEVMSNLGPTPPIGSVYGQKIEPLVKTRPSKFWEEIRLYRAFTPKEEQELVAGISTAYKKLRGLNLPAPLIELEVRQPQGKSTGYYKFRPKSDADVMGIRPDANLEDLSYIVFHEYGNGIWYRCMTPMQRLSWVRLYHEYITLQEVTQADLDQILGEVEGAGSISAFFKAADEQTQMIFKIAMRQISQVHGLQKKHLDMSLTQGESISDYWPVTLELSEKETALTDNGKASPEALFAESFAHHVAGRKLPKKIKAVLDTTLTKLTAPIGAQVATRRSNPDDEPAPTKKSKSKRKAGLK